MALARSVNITATSKRHGRYFEVWCTSTGVMLSQPFLERLGETGVMAGGLALANEKVNVVQRVFHNLHESAFAF